MITVYNFKNTLTKNDEVCFDCKYLISHIN